MKRFFIYILIIIATGFGTYKFKNSISDEMKQRVLVAIKEKNWEKLSEVMTPGPCEKPFLYSIGSVDHRFEISAEEFQKTIAEAEKIWENEIGKNLFEYSPEGTVNVSLIFDARQETSRESEKLDYELAKISSDVDFLDEKYARLKKEYDKKTEEYETSAKKYEKKQKDYNTDVDYWNSQGGAPEDDYEKLQDEKEELEDYYEKLEKKKKEINKAVEEINALAKKEDKLVKDYNQKINTYKNKYGMAREFEKGVYNGQEINVYQFNEVSDLRLVLTHELGHVLGIGHVENPASLMFYLMAEQYLDEPKLSAEDIAAMKSVCK